MQNTRIAVRSLLLCMAFTVCVLAHPHVFVDATVNIQFSEAGFTGVKNHWVYDEVYSAAMIASGDKNGDGKISADENGWFKSEILDPIEKSNYYNYVLKGASFLGVKKIENFKASVKNGRLILDFDAVFFEPVQKDYTMIVVVVADPSNYIQISANMENSDAEAPDQIDVEFFDDVLDGLTMFRTFQSNVKGLYLRYCTK